MQNELTFDQLPIAVSQLTKEVNELKQLLLEKSEQQPTSSPDKLLKVPDAAEFLGLSIPTIYSKVSRGELPVMKRTKRLYFSREELTDYLKAGRKKTNLEIEQEANIYLKGGLSDE